MDLRNTQLKDTYGNLVTTGTTAGSPTTGGLQNGQGTLLTSVGIGTDSPNALLELSGRSDTGDITMRFADKDGGVLTGQDHSNIEYFATDGSAVSAEVKTIYADVVGGLDYTISTRAGGGSLAERLRIRSTGDISFRDGSASEAFYWDASAGSLGIGTTSPEKKLQVSGDAKIDTFLTVGDSGQANTYLYLLSSTSGTSNLRMGDTDTDAGAIIYSNASNFMDFRVNASERLRIDSSGNVGIGTDNPATRLDIQGVGGATTSPSVTATTGTSYIGWKSVNTGGSFWTAIDNSTGSSFSTGTAYARVLWSNGAYPMVFSTNSTERLRIDSSGNVGIGTTSLNAAYKLQVSSNGTSRIIQAVRNDGGDFVFGKESSSGNSVISGAPAYAGIISVNSAHPLVFGTNSAEKMRIDSSGNVGIGTNDPSTKLEVLGSSNSNYLRLSGDDAAGARGLDFTSFTVNANAGAGHQINAKSIYGTLTFATSNTERLRIDSDGNITQSGTSPQYIFKTASNTNFQIAVQENVSNALEITPSTTVGGTTFSNPALVVNSSGNVLVGKTSSSNAQTTVGHLFLPDGRHYATASGGVSGIFSRTSSDGDILSFYKDGTTVGNIGASGGRLYIGSDDTSIFFDSGDSPSIRPHGPVDPDGVIDIGDSGTRFKDLYLSGSVYLGGTTSANALDDYEEGTFELTLNGSTSNPTTAVTTTAHYTKIGNVVHYNFRFENVDTTGASGNITFSGFPFTTTSTNNSSGAVDIFQMANFNGAEYLNLYIGSTTTAGEVLGTRSNNGWINPQHNVGTGRYINASITVHVV